MDKTLTDCYEAEEKRAHGHCEMREPLRGRGYILRSLRHKFGPTFLRRMLDGISRRI